MSRKNRKIYIICTSSNMFDHYECLNKEGYIDWWISPQPNIGDIFYIYSEKQDAIIAKTIVERTELRKANSKMDEYYEANLYDEYEHPKGYNPLKCMRIKLITLSTSKEFQFLHWKNIQKFGIEWPTHNNKSRDVTWSKKLINYLSNYFE